VNVARLAIPDVLLIEPDVFTDHRGQFVELWQDARYRELGIGGPFVQDNVSQSRRGVLRGLHYQWPSAQGKLVTVLHGTVYDVAVDLRCDSPTYGKWIGQELSAESGRQLWIPTGLAHGFLALTDLAVFQYKATKPYTPGDEVTIRWDDPQLGIQWPIAEPVLGKRDATAPTLAEVPRERLPTCAPAS
jgi:dTDP-4-dehydrorhamnose 3,5-epimerase